MKQSEVWFVTGSDLLSGRIKTKVQDACSMRSTPQVIGAAHDAVAFARAQVETELNGVGDNPIFLPEARLTLTGANFHGTPVSAPMDMVGAAVTMVCVLSERRLNRLNHPAFSVGLPAFLTKGAGMFSGLMLSQYTTDSLIVEQRILSMPASIQSIPAAADQEDCLPALSPPPSPSGPAPARPRASPPHPRRGRGRAAAGRIHHRRLHHPQDPRPPRPQPAARGSPAARGHT